MSTQYRGRIWLPVTYLELASAWLRSRWWLPLDSCYRVRPGAGWSAGLPLCCRVWGYRTPWGALHGSFRLHRARRKIEQRPGVPLLARADTMAALAEALRTREEIRGRRNCVPGISCTASCGSGPCSRRCVPCGRIAWSGGQDAPCPACPDYRALPLVLLIEDEAQEMPRGQQARDEVARIMRGGRKGLS